MSSFDLKAFLDEQKKTLNPEVAKVIGVGDALPALGDEDYLKMPEWWVKATKTIGLPYGRIVMLAGDTDTGKTSMAIQAMKAAQEQDVTIFYVETENKTTEKDFIVWGVDPQKVIVIPSNVAEVAYDTLFKLIKAFKEKNPKGKLLVIIDSMGNVVSQRSASMDLVNDSDKPGEKGKINRLAMEILVSHIHGGTKIATLLINYTYDNIGSHGKTNSGGKGPSQYSSLIYQTARKGWLEKTVKGEKVRYGAEVVWNLTKNHINKNNPGSKKVTLEITAEGMKVVEIID